MKPDWSREGRDWPNRVASRFVRANGLTWHVQVMGSGPPMLLLHGAGAATHSWRDLAPILADHFTIVAPDLPGHGFTETPRSGGLSLDSMAAELNCLLKALEVRPEVVVGHSAGAAIAMRMRIDGQIGDGGLISLNGALRPFGGAASHIYPTVARLMFLNPLAIRIFALRAGRPGAVSRLIERTGSRIEPRGIDLYTRLFTTTGHIAGALGMMASWNLHPLLSDMPRLAGPVTLVVAEGDLAVPPQVGEVGHSLIQASDLVKIPRLGHLAHEEAPGQVAALVLSRAGAH